MMINENEWVSKVQNPSLKNDFIPNKNYGWRDKLKKRRRLLINVTHAAT